MHDLVIRGGTAVTETWSSEVDIGVRDEEIVSISEPGSLDSDAQVIDAQGKYVFPGLIDAHVHVNVSLGEFVTKGTFNEVTAAAAHGGTTTVVDFAIPENGESPLESFERKRDEAAGNTYVDYGFHGCLTEVNNATLDMVSTLVERGAGTIKAFMVYPGLLRLDHGEILDLMAEVESNGGMMFVHAEDQEVIDYLTARQVESGNTGPPGLVESHPPVSESSAMGTIVDLVDETGCPVHFVHVSSSRSASILEDARRRDLPIFAETCPHYLSVDESAYRSADGHLYACSPPVRKEDDRDGLWQLIQREYIQAVNSDHAAFTADAKAKYADDFTQMPMGVPGVETRNLMAYSEGVAGGRVSLQRFVSLTSTHMARLLGLYPDKGTITVGTDADLTVWDPNPEWTLSNDALHMPTTYTPFEGHSMTGRPQSTIVRGEVVVHNAEVTGDVEHGQFVETDPRPS